MNILWLIVMTLVLSLPAYAEEQLLSVDFTSDGTSPVGVVLEDGVFRVNEAGESPMVTLFEIDDPGISSPVYALKGSIRHEGIEGEAFLQMDSHFGDKGTYFTKTLAPAGPLGVLTGDADWRAFVLPFNAGTSDAAGNTITPEKLTVSLYRPGAGTVFLRDVELFQYASGEDPLQISGQWLDNRTMALVGAIGGTFIGLWSGLLGFLASRGKARVFVLGSVVALIIVGAAALVAGFAAMAARQAYAVYYPLLLIGVILVIVYGSVIRSLPKRYADVELKKMQAMDA